MENLSNLRDTLTSKPKSTARKIWYENYDLLKMAKVENYDYQSNKAKRIVRKFNDLFNESKSEFIDEYAIGIATTVHHIFPFSEFPEISDTLENLITLTPTQHFNQAHGNFNTHRIDQEYQRKLLIAKLNTIHKNMNDKIENQIYSLEKFINVLNVGYSLNLSVDEQNYESILKFLSELIFD